MIFSLRWGIFVRWHINEHLMEEEAMDKIEQDTQDKAELIVFITSSSPIGNKDMGEISKGIVEINLIKKGIYSKGNRSSVVLKVANAKKRNLMAFVSPRKNANSKMRVQK